MNKWDFLKMSYMLSKYSTETFRILRISVNNFGNFQTSPFFLLCACHFQNQIAPDKLKHGGQTSLQAITIGERDHNSVWAFKTYPGRIKGHQYLPISFTQRKRKLSCVFMTEGSFTLVARCPGRGCRLLASHRDWSALFFEEGISKV